MLTNKNTISGNGADGRGNEPYERPRLVARGNILSLTQGGTGFPAEANGGVEADPQGISGS